jgi:hypothetical protein
MGRGRSSIRNRFRLEATVATRDWPAPLYLFARLPTHFATRGTKPTLVYRRTKNLRAVQLVLGHSKLERTVRYLGIEVADALEIAEQTEV